MEFLRDVALPTAALVIGAVTFVLGIIGHVALEKLAFSLNRLQQIILSAFGLMLIGVAIYTYNNPPRSGPPTVLPTQVSAPTQGILPATQNLTVLPVPTQATLAITTTQAPQETEAYSQGDCEQVSPPCTYTVGLDSFFLISQYFYGTHEHAPKLMTLNRDSDGYFVRLDPGVLVFIPALQTIPSLQYPSCEARQFPCQYVVHQGDTYESIAKDYYGSTGASEIIRKANNLQYDALTDTVSALTLKTGIVLVLPIKR